MFISTARRYKCNISDWIALVTGNILEICSFNMALNKTELLSFHYIQEFSNSVSLHKYHTYIGTRVSNFMLKMLSASCCQQFCSQFRWFCEYLSLSQ